MNVTIQVVLMLGVAAGQAAGLATAYLVFQATAGQPAIDWQVVLLALIAAIPPTVTAWLAYRKASEAKTEAVGAKAASNDNGQAIEVVKKQTDGLASAMKNAGFAEGVKQEQDATSATAQADARQASMIEAVVARLLAAQTAVLVAPVAVADPGPVAATQISAIKTTVDDIQPRVVDIESATVNVADKVKDLAAGTDDRLTTLEKKES